VSRSRFRRSADTTSGKSRPRSRRENTRALYSILEHQYFQEIRIRNVQARGIAERRKNVLAIHREAIEMVCGHDPGRIRKNPSTRWGFDSEVQAINEHLIVVRDELGSARLHFFLRKQEDAGFTGFSSRGAARVAVKHIGRVVTARIAI